MAQLLDYGLEVNEFKFRSCSCFHFRTNTLEKKETFDYWLKSVYRCFSTRKALAFNNQQMLIYHLKKKETETQLSQYNSVVYILRLILTHRE